MKQQMPSGKAAPKATRFAKSNGTKAGGGALPIQGHNKNLNHPAAAKVTMKDSQRGRNPKAC